MNKKIFYVYYHINPETKEVFYVGKGTGQRLYEWSCRRSEEHYRVQKEIRDKGLKPKAIIVDTFESELDAYRAELSHIEALRAQNAPLVNKAEGGIVLSGSANPMYGKKRPDKTEWNRKLKGLSYEERYGPKKAQEIKQKQSLPGIKNGMYGKSREDLACRNRDNAGKSYEEIYGFNKAEAVKAKLGGKAVIRSDGQKFTSIKSAAKQSGATAYLIKRHLAGYLKTVNGYSFQYVNSNTAISKQS